MPSGNACPRCGQGRLFNGFLGLKPACSSCGLNYDFSDSGDGPAVFVILAEGALLVGAALFVDVHYEPPLWLMAVVFLPLALVVSLGMLRPLKAAMIHRQYSTRAAEARSR